MCRTCCEVEKGGRRGTRSMCALSRVELRHAQSWWTLVVGLRLSFVKTRRVEVRDDRSRNGRRVRCEIEGGWTE